MMDKLPANARLLARIIVSCLFMIVFTGVWVQPAIAQDLNPNPPDEPVKLIFIHHSTGENWLRDGYGNLGRTLDENNYFVSDTNYGWGPDGIGDRTDIVNWPEWFGAERSERVLNAVFNESGQNSGEITRTLPDPGGENTIILFKSCFPNSELGGNPDDPPAPGGYDLTVGSAKNIYNSLLEYFLSRPDKMFVVITAPPVSNPDNAANARAFNDWLMTEWLNGYGGSNVFVFDFYNVLTGKQNHHYYQGGTIQWVKGQNRNTSAYASGGGDDHPNAAGSQKATDEFIPLLNIWYHQWRANAPLEPPSSGQEEPEDQPEEPEDASGSGTTGPVTSGALVEDFEEAGIEFMLDVDGNGSTIECKVSNQDAYSGEGTLQISYNMVAEGYGGCARYFDTSKDLSGGQGLMVHMRSDQPTYVTIRVLSNNIPYEANTTIEENQTNEWFGHYFGWSEFVHSSWDTTENAPERIDPSQIADVSISLWAQNATQGNLWVDAIFLAEGESQPGSEGETEEQTESQVEEQPETQAEEAAENAEEEQAEPPAEEEDGGRKSLCPAGAALIPLGLIFVFRKRK